MRAPRGKACRGPALTAFSGLFRDANAGRPHADDGFSGWARSLFHGDGTNRWCDKSFNLVIFPNGKAGLHTEHAWADAPGTPRSQAGLGNLPTWAHAGLGGSFCLAAAQ